MISQDLVASQTIRAQNSALPLHLLGALGGLAATIYWWSSSEPFQFPFDDSYITLEFARNFAALGRLTYDGIHPAPGTTSLLHVLLLALPARLGLPLDRSDAVLGVLFFILLIERTGALAMRLTGQKLASLFAALTTALTGYFVYDALNGLETTFFMFLTVGCAAALVHSFTTGRAPMRPGAWLFLTVLARPEGFWFAASLMLYPVVRAVVQPMERRRLIIPAAFLAAAVVLGLAFQWLITGSVTPHTALAKVYLYNQFRQPFGERLGIYLHGMRTIFGPLALLLFPALWARSSRPLAAMLLPWVLITQVMFLILLPLEVTSYWGRYMHPLLPFVFVLSGDGVADVADHLGKYRVARWGLAVLLVFAGLIWWLNFTTMLRQFENDKAVIRDNNFWAVEWLRQHAGARVRVATHDIGVIRYVGGYRILDISGLTDEEAMIRNQAQRGQFAYLQQERPDYLIGNHDWFADLFHYHPDMRCCMAEVALANPQAYTSIRFTIYRCRWEGAASTIPLSPY